MLILIMMVLTHLSRGEVKRRTNTRRWYQESFLYMAFPAIRASKAVIKQERIWVGLSGQHGSCLTSSTLVAKKPPVRPLLWEMWLLSVAASPSMWSAMADPWKPVPDCSFSPGLPSPFSLPHAPSSYLLGPLVSGFWCLQLYTISFANRLISFCLLTSDLQDTPASPNPWQPPWQHSPFLPSGEIQILVFTDCLILTPCCTWTLFPHYT